MAQAEAGEAWSADLQGLVRTWYGEVRQARYRQQVLTPTHVALALQQYAACLESGYRAHPEEPIPKRRGRPKRLPAVNLLNAFRDHADATCAF